MPDDVVKSIGAYGGDDIVFICTECRSNDGTEETVDKQAFRQLFHTVRELCIYLDVPYRKKAMLVLSSLHINKSPIFP